MPAKFLEQRGTQTEQEAGLAGLYERVRAINLALGGQAGPVSPGSGEAQLACYSGLEEALACTHRLVAGLQQQHRSRKLELLAL